MPEPKPTLLTPEQILKRLEEEDQRVKQHLARIRSALEKMAGAQSLGKIADVLEDLAENEDLPRIASALEKMFGIVGKKAQ